ncbi:hypothetical protein CEE69_22880 [Rhodopirellula bahusiensis]|uniref:Uncharacterized protein n=2 Tax=Rhodopirellula bahusiensis TaxID=2014065 RepID=A0A2G1W235_9BACT|nr:hypothetical protein CEE69_22880 [Rhodopirellula bahusiensis]
MSIFTCVGVFAQEAAPVDDPFRPAESERGTTEWKPVHPDGDTSIARMMSLVYTDALPAFDRVEICAVSFPKRDPFDEAESKRDASDKTFPVRPYGIHADIHARANVTGKDCEELRTAWQSLSFDRLGGAFCHYPAYGLRFYRDDQILFETSVCWQCQNFYLPSYDEKKGRFTYGWYGFANDEKAKRLLTLLRRHLPHPKLNVDRKTGG